MLIDAQLRFSDEQAVTAAAASENILDLGIERYPGTGKNLYLVVLCTVAMTDGGSDSTLEVKLQSDAAAAFSSPADVPGGIVGTFPATSAIGAQLQMRLPPAAAFERFSRLYFTPANGDLSTGSFSAFIVHDIDAWNAYAKNYTIS